MFGDKGEQGALAGRGAPYAKTHCSPRQRGRSSRCLCRASDGARGHSDRGHPSRGDTMKTKTKVKAGGLSTSPIGFTPPKPFGP